MFRDRQLSVYEITERRSLLRALTVLEAYFAAALALLTRQRPEPFFMRAVKVSTMLFTH